MHKFISSTISYYIEYDGEEYICTEIQLTNDTSPSFYAKTEGDDQIDPSSDLYHILFDLFYEKPRYVSPIDKLRAHLASETEEHIAFAKERYPGEWEDIFDNIEPVNKNEDTLWEQGYRSGIETAIRIIDPAIAMQAED